MFVDGCAHNLFVRFYALRLARSAAQFAALCVPFYKLQRAAYAIRPLAQPSSHSRLQGSLFQATGSN